MKKKLLKFICLSALIVSLSISLNSCGKDILDGETALKSGEMQATVSGSGQGTGHFYATDAHVIDGGVAATYFIAATVKDQNNSDSLVIHILIPKLPTVPYTIDVAKDPTAVVDYCVNTASACITYQSKLNKGSAVVKITELTPNVQGTFSGTLTSDDGSTSVTFTNGGFNASF